MATTDTSFAWRLRCAIQATNKTQKEICGEIGISAPTLSQYLAGNRDPSMTTIIALARTLQVSTDYLLGLSSVTQPEGGSDHIASKYDFRDSTIRFFEELQSRSEENENILTCAEGIPDEYKQYVRYDQWTHVRYLEPIVDEQSFFFDVLEHPKMREISEYVFYYQMARSYLRLFKDRRDAYTNDLNEQERLYAACMWDTPEGRRRQYGQMPKETQKLLSDGWFTQERENFHIDGIPSVYADKAMIYREQIKQGLCKIIDECCDKFELSHDQHFRQQKQQFIVRMKNNAMIYATTTDGEGE